MGQCWKSGYWTSGDCHGPGSRLWNKGYKILSFSLVLTGQCGAPPLFWLFETCLDVAEVGFKCLIFLPASASQVLEFQLQTTTPGPVFIVKGTFSALPSGDISPSVHYINAF